MSSSHSARDSFIAWLRKYSAAIKECEQKADASLYGDNNESAYRELMRKKASLLASLAGEAAPRMDDALSGQEKERARETLAGFSQNARTALRLDSVFYMSALLYPDDHRKGEPDNLEKFIASLA